MTRLTTTALFALLLSIAAPQAAASGPYVVSATIEQDGATVGTPTLLVAPDATANVAVAGDAGYELSVLVRPDESSDEVSVQVELVTSRGRVSSTATTSLGEPLAIARGDVGLEVLVSREAD